MLLRGVLMLLLLLVPVAAAAVGPLVGKDCAASWSPVTTFTDGTAITIPVSYNVYVAPGTPSAPPGVPLLAGVTSTAAQPCLALPVGQHTVWVTAVVVFTGSRSESAPSAPFPFVLGAPVAPQGVLVK